MQKSLRCKDSRLGFGILILFGISLARKSAAEKPEVWHCFWVCFSCIFYEPLSLRVKQGVVTAVGVFVDFAVPYACKVSGTGQSFAEAADAGEHIYELDQEHDSLWGYLPDLQMCLIGAPHQKTKAARHRLHQTRFFYRSLCINLLLPSAFLPIIKALESPPTVNSGNRAQSLV